MVAIDIDRGSCAGRGRVHDVRSRIQHIWGGGKLPGTAGLVRIDWYPTPASGHDPAGAVTGWARPSPVVGCSRRWAPPGARHDGRRLVANQMNNGFFIFRTGEATSYVLQTVCVALASVLGGGRVSLDNAFGIDLTRWGGFFMTLGGGGGGGALWCGGPPGPGRVPAKRSQFGSVNQ